MAAIASSLAVGRALQECEETDSEPDPSSYPPEKAWLQSIRSEAASNQVAAARHQLQCWQRVYPQAVVPDDLKDLLSSP